MTAPFNDGAIFLGNSVSFSDAILQTDGVTPYNLANTSVQFSGKLDPNAGTVFNKSVSVGTGVSTGDIQVPTPSNGLITAWLRATDSFWGQLLPWALLYLYLIVTDSSGNVYTTKKFTARLAV